MNNVLVTGGDGILASYLSGTHLSRTELDVCEYGFVLALFQKMLPSVVIHTAAETNLVACEADSVHAFRINALGIYNVALAARAVGAKLVYISTSGVFDGTKLTPYSETDIPNPVNVYGHSKYLGELAVAGMSQRHLIVRASWLFGGGSHRDTKFVGKILAQQGEELKAVNDKQGSPTYVKDLAAHITKLIEADATGIHHYSGGVATRFDVATELQAIMHSDRTVVGVPSSEFPLPYRTGANEGMEVTPGARPWQEALREYVATEWK